MSIQAFIFDLDGVLTDTAEAHFRAWKRLADEQGIPFNRKDNEALRGVSRRESLNRLLKGLSIGEEQAQAWMERKNRYYVEMLHELSPADVLPGAQELLAEISRMGGKIAIASASQNSPYVVERLQLASSIDVLVNGSQVENTKPAPDLFLLAARELGVEPSRCVVVEDAEAGIQAGIAAGMFTIGIGPASRVGQANLVLPNLENQHIDDILQKIEYQR